MLSWALCCSRGADSVRSFPLVVMIAWGPPRMVCMAFIAAAYRKCNAAVKVQLGRRTRSPWMDIAEPCMTCATACEHCHRHPPKRNCGAQMSLLPHLPHISTSIIREHSCFLLSLQSLSLNIRSVVAPSTPPPRKQRPAAAFRTPVVPVPYAFHIPRHMCAHRNAASVPHRNLADCFLAVMNPPQGLRVHSSRDCGGAFASYSGGSFDKRDRRRGDRGGALTGPAGAKRANLIAVRIHFCYRYNKPRA
jgi:hypothetical protein